MPGKFPNGVRVLNYGTNLDWHVVVDDDGMDTAAGRFVYTQPPGSYIKSATLAIERSSATEYVAIHDGTNYSGTWT